MAALPKLTYFAGRGRAELIRLILAEGSVEYEDFRLTFQEWPAYKAANLDKFPFAQMPTYEVDGKILSQSISTARYLAKQHGLVPANDYDAYLCDALVDGVVDFRNAGYKAWFSPADQKEAALAAFAADVVPVWVKRYEGFLQSNNNGEGWFVGNECTWADLAVFDHFSFVREMFGAAFAEAPLLSAHLDRVAARPKIAAWLARRPVSQM
eukprot:TRINITY_DN2768_c0_g1_i4.p2 TRINITY_DN2768_c0_g1~~TRINITY_DN2768_c0_g1_i4.p2  ORF type:complete len:210 (-),score=96.68 TRINITY_DN2768_c0_g1_i4:144-773(-)